MMAPVVAGGLPDKCRIEGLEMNEDGTTGFYTPGASYDLTFKHHSKGKLAIGASAGSLDRSGCKVNNGIGFAEDSLVEETTAAWKAPVDGRCLHLL